MFKFITKWFGKKVVAPNPVIKLVVPEGAMSESHVMVDPSKSGVVKDVGDMPGTIEENGIKRDVGHINFNNTKSITRKFKRERIRKSIEERKSSYYDDDGIIYLG